MLSATTATTLLGNIRANLTAIRERVGDRLVLAAVKANAYGHGAVEVSRMIEATGAADWLGVATADEAVQLRDAGVRLPVLKLSHALSDDQVAACVDRDVDLTVVSAGTIDQVARVAATSRRTAFPRSRRRNSCWIVCSRSSASSSSISRSKLRVTRKL